MMSLYQLSLLLILAIQFSTILSQPPLKWKRVQRPMNTTTIGYVNPTTETMIYKSEKPRLADPQLENPSTEADDIGSQTPTNPEANTENNYALDSETPGLGKVNNQNSIPESVPANLEANTQSNKASVIEVPPVTEVIKTDSKFGTDLPNVAGKTESNKPLDNEAPAFAEGKISDPKFETHPSKLEVNIKSNKESTSPEILSPSVTPSNRRGDFILQEEDYLKKDSLVPLIRSGGVLEKIVDEFNEDVREQCVLAKEASFTHMQDVSNKAKINSMIRSNSALADVKAMYWRKLKDQPDVGQSPLVDKMIHEIVDLIGPACLPTTESQGFEIAKSTLETSYRKRKVKVSNSYGNISTEREIQADVVDSILAVENRTSYEKKLYYWTKWHLATDNQSEENFAIYVVTLNKAAKLQGLRNGREMINKVFHDPKLEVTIDKLWDQIKPTIEILKKFIIKNLKEYYGGDYKYKGNHIPAHLIGSLQGNNWESLYPMVKPYPCLEEKPDLAEADIYNRTYYVYCQNSKKLTDSMMIPRNPKFCESLIHAKLNSGNIDCRPKGYDFCKGTTYLVPVCLNEKKYEHDAHVEMEKMFYAAEYSKQPFVLRKSPHPGLEQAIALLFALQTEKLSLGEGQTGEEDEMNLMMLEALRILPQLPYALSQEKFRTYVISGDIAQTKWNKQWWKLRAEYEGIEPEYHGIRGEFDPAANYDINLVNYQYNRFLGIIMYYQLLQSSCAGSVIKQCKDKGVMKSIQKPLHQCSLIGKADFGAKIKAAQALGSSTDWQVIWKNLTGNDQINANALVEYFKPVTNLMSKQTIMDTPYWWAILVGFIIVIIMIVIVLIYYIGKSRKTKEDKVAERAANDNPAVVVEGEVGDKGTYRGLESMELGEDSGK